MLLPTVLFHAPCPFSRIDATAVKLHQWMAGEPEAGILLEEEVRACTKKCLVSRPLWYRRDVMNAQSVASSWFPVPMYHSVACRECTRILHCCCFFCARWPFSCVTVLRTS